MSPAVRTRPLLALVTIPPFFALVIVAAQLVTSGPGISQPPRHAPPTARQSERPALREAAAAMAATIVKPIIPAHRVPAPPPAPALAPTPTPPPPAPAPTPTPPPSTPSPAPATAAPAPAPTPAPTDPGVVPPVGQATAWGCAAAVAYLQVYAAKGFSIECPGYAEGREAMTCTNRAPVCPGTSLITIADPCPQAYMNEASNSLVLMGLSDAPIDPFGACP